MTLCFYNDLTRLLKEAFFILYSVFTLLEFLNLLSLILNYFIIIFSLKYHFYLFFIFDLLHAGLKADN